MRILHLLNHCNRSNGHVHVAVDLACEQVRRGHTVFVASGGGHFEELLSQAGVRHLRFDQQDRRVTKLPRLVSTFRDILRETQADIVHAHMMTGTIIAFIACRFGRARLVTHVHNSFDRSSMIMALGDRVVAVSTAVAELMVRRGTPRGRVRVALNGPIGSARRAHAPEPPHALQRPSITTVCGLHGRKGVPELIEAFTIVARTQETAHLYIVGDGPARESYENLALARGLRGRVHFAGSVTDPRPYLAATDIFVLASHADPCPLVIPEAREAGCAIVATSVDGIPEALDGGAAGELVAPRNPVELAERLTALLTDPARLSAMRSRSRSNLESFSVARVCERMDAIYGELVA